MKLMFTLLFLALSATAFAQPQKDELTAILGGLVQSDRWLINKDQQTEEFIGNLHYANDNYTIKADYGLSDRRNNIFKLKGNVFASQKLNGTQAQVKANEVFYNHKKDYGYLLPKRSQQLQAIYILQNNKITLFADRIDFKDKLSQITAAGNCELGDINNTLYAAQMIYNMQTGIFTATGQRPVLFGYSDDGDYALQADTITMQTKEKVYKAQGGVQGWITTTQDLTNIKGKTNGTKIK